MFHFKVVLPKLPENREVVQRISLLGKRGFVSILEAFDEGKSVTKRKIEGRRKAVLSPLHTFKSHNGHNTAVSWSPDGTRLVSCSFDGTAKVWDTSNGKVLHTLKDQEGGVNFAAWSPDGTRIASRGEGLKIRVKVTGECA